MRYLTNKIESSKKQILTVEKLNSIGDLYLKKGDKQKAIAHFYQAAEKVHISQKDKKLAIYKKILNISTSESSAYEQIIDIFVWLGLAAEEKKYLISLANLYQNKGELNKLDALYRRIKEIDSGNHPVERYFSKDKPEDTGIPDAAVTEINNEAAPLTDSISELNPSSNYHLNEMPLEDRSKFMVELRNYSKYILLFFLFILSGYAFYLFAGHSESRNISSKTNEIALQTDNFEIKVLKMTNLDELKGRVDENSIENNSFYLLSVKAKKACINDLFVADPSSMISFTDKKGNQFRTKDIKGLGALKKVVYRANACSNNAGAVFMKVICACDKKIADSGLSLTGLEKEWPAIIRWD